MNPIYLVFMRGPPLRREAGLAVAPRESRVGLPRQNLTVRYGGILARDGGMSSCFIASCWDARIFRPAQASSRPLVLLLRQPIQWQIGQVQVVNVFR